MSHPVTFPSSHFRPINVNFVESVTESNAEHVVMNVVVSGGVIVKSNMRHVMMILV